MIYMLKYRVNLFNFTNDPLRKRSENKQIDKLIKFNTESFEVLT